MRRRGLANKPLKRWNTIMAKSLAQFSIARTGDEYLITLEDQDGDTTEWTAEYEQLDLITEAIEEQLDADEEEALSADDDEEDLAEEDDA